MECIIYYCMNAVNCAVGLFPNWAKVNALTSSFTISFTIANEKSRKFDIKKYAVVTVDYSL